MLEKEVFFPFSFAGWKASWNVWPHLLEERNRHSPISAFAFIANALTQLLMLLCGQPPYFSPFFPLYLQPQSIQRMIVQACFWKIQFVFEFLHRYGVSSHNKFKHPCSLSAFSVIQPLIFPFTYYAVLSSPPHFVIALIIYTYILAPCSF